MHALDYTWDFDYIGEQLKKGRMRLTDHATNKTYTLQVAVDDGQLSLIDYRSIPPLLADLIDIAAAVHMADRLSKGDGDMPRRMLLRLPIRVPEIRDRPSIHQKLQEILYWFTEDYWSFEFTPYCKLGRSAEINLRLPSFQESPCPSRVVLWSGGLDSFAGVYQLLLKDENTHCTLFGTGSSHIISSTQRHTAAAIETFFPQRTKLVQLPFHLKDKCGDVKKSSYARSRGFVFMLLGAVCARQEDQNALYICENGIGAINLPFRKSEVGLDHSRSVHPLSLLAMGDLLSSILNQPFSFENPFLWSTKAEMCKEPLQMGAAKSMFSAISCDSRHRKQPIQCGYCSSCLLRRQAIAFHDVSDQTRYQILNGTIRNRRKDYGTHYYAMLNQVDTMRVLLSADDSWQSMSKHYGNLVDIVEKVGECQTVTQDHILRLYRNYVQEWDRVRDIIGQGFPE
jgi:7-cyano-7-deazaguanine synthase in queuosine biosynthesis